MNPQNFLKFMFIDLVFFMELFSEKLFQQLINYIHITIINIIPNLGLKPKMRYLNSVEDLQVLKAILYKTSCFNCI